MHRVSNARGDAASDIARLQLLRGNPRFGACSILSSAARLSFARVPAGLAGQVTAAPFQGRGQGFESARLEVIRSERRTGVDRSRADHVVAETH
jgi:hypothetical protein